MQVHLVWHNSLKGGNGRVAIYRVDFPGGSGIVGVMKTTKVTIVEGDAWFGLYMDGVLKYQDNDRYHFWDYLYRIPITITYVVLTDRQSNHLFNVGHLPEKFEDIKKGDWQ